MCKMNNHNLNSVLLQCQTLSYMPTNSSKQTLFLFCYGFSEKEKEKDSVFWRKAVCGCLVPPCDNNPGCCPSTELSYSQVDPRLQVWLQSAGERWKCFSLHFETKPDGRVTCGSGVMWQVMVPCSPLTWLSCWPVRDSRTYLTFCCQKWNLGLFLGVLLIRIWFHHMFC